MELRVQVSDCNESVMQSCKLCCIGWRPIPNVSDAELVAGAAVGHLAQALGCTPAQVAINWVRQQPGLVIPILGCRTVAQLQDNPGCLDFRLREDELATFCACLVLRPFNF